LFRRAVKDNRVPKIVNIDTRALNDAGIVEQGFADFRCGRIILSGVELVHLIRKRRVRDDGRGLSAQQSPKGG